MIKTNFDLNTEIFITQFPLRMVTNDNRLGDTFALIIKVFRGTEVPQLLRLGWYRLFTVYPIPIIFCHRYPTIHFTYLFYGL
jgi:hypothetical protein